MPVKELRLKDLAVGMEVAKDLVDVSGRMLLVKGTILTPRLITRIQTMLADRPDIAVQVDADSIAPTVDNQAHKLLEAASGLQQAMTAVRNSQSIDMGPVEDAVVTIVGQAQTTKGLWEFVETVWERHHFVYYHSVAVAGLAASIAKWQGLPANEILEVSLAGYFHDIGKVRQDNDNHPWIGVELLTRYAGVSSRVLAGVLQHHERCDGSGFPNGTKASGIDPYGKILGAANAFHRLSLASQRTGSMFLLPAAEQILKEAPVKFDSMAARALLESLIPFYRGRDVRLSSEETGQIVFIDPAKPSAPIVQTASGAVECGRASGIHITEVI